MRKLPRRFLAVAMHPLALLAASCARSAEARPVVTVYNTPTCGCCTNCVEHLGEHGFTVETVDRPDLTSIERQHAVPRALESCHTGVVGGYVIEGHRPACDSGMGNGR